MPVFLRQKNTLTYVPAFFLQYYGKGSEEIKAYCKEYKFYNTDFYGGFSQSNTFRFYEKTDIINNIYGNDTINLQLALSNKLYYGLLFKIPILVSDNTLMEKLIKEYNIGISFENNLNFPDKLYNWYKTTKESDEKRGFNVLWNRFLDEDNQCIEQLEKFLIN